MPDIRVPVRVQGSVDADVDGQRVVLSPKDFAFFGIEGSGAQVWDLIDGARTIDDIVMSLGADFGAPEGTIRGETLAFLEELTSAGLLVEFGHPGDGG